MRKVGGSLELSATDLVGYLNCHHLTVLDRAVAEGVRAKPRVWDDPLLKILWERGAIHEQNFVQHLKDAGLEVIRIDGTYVTDEAVAETLASMKKGVQVIVQGALSHQGWGGRADVLRRVEVPSALGDWAYEAIDTKLVRETKAGRSSSFASILICYQRRRARRPSTCMSSRPGRTKFSPAEFLETRAQGRVIATHSKKEVIFAQGDDADTVFYYQEGQGQSRHRIRGG